MKSILVFLLATFSLEVLAVDKAPSCDDSGAGHEKIEIVRDAFTTKVDPKNKSKILPKVLYCDKPRSTGGCNDGSVWFSYNQFVKYKANYRQVICSYINIKITNGTPKQKIIIYVNANEADQH